MNISLFSYTALFISWLITFFCLVKSWNRVVKLSCVNESLYASIRQIRSELNEKDKNIESLTKANDSYIEMIKGLKHDADY